MSFATNDERTAKRVSDSLGTATELRAMQNYAGHRLAPWLGHIMISRQETARALMTPGEIMQLPPTDAIVMVSGMFPIKAKKARYFADPRLAERVLPAPKSDETAKTSPRPDDWSGLPVLTVPDPSARATGRRDAEDGDPANSGIRREPELPVHEDIEPRKTAQFEFDLDADEPDDDAATRQRVLDRAMRQVARQASMDRNDGIEL